VTDSHQNVKYSPVIITKGSLLSRVREAYKRGGRKYLIQTSINYIREGSLVIAPSHFMAWYYNTFKSSETFKFHGNIYHYLFHPYCTTWQNERTVVIPIVWNIIKKYQEEKKRILEIGNVLSYVFRVSHDVLDKYEITEGIINDDVVNFNPSKQYDLIVSIFTLQSVGWDETPRDNEKFISAIENLKRILAQNGQLIIIHGLGYNLEMDKFLENGMIQFNEQYYLKRNSKFNWQEASWEDVKDLGYDYSIPTAKGVVMGIIKKE
jgi:hypothetical protein